MGKITVSKCGARLNKKVTSLLYAYPHEDFAQKEKPIQKKRTYRKAAEKIGEDFPVNLEDENLDGVSV